MKLSVFILIIFSSCFCSNCGILKRPTIKHIECYGQEVSNIKKHRTDAEMERKLKRINKRRLKKNGVRMQ